MPEQYVTSDKRNGLEVAVTGEFPTHHDDRIRIARTTNLFTRLLATILLTDGDSLRRQRFAAIETQLEVADALIREDVTEVQRLLRETMQKMGVTPEQLDEITKRIVDELGRNDDDPLGGDALPPPAEPA